MSDASDADAAPAHGDSPVPSTVTDNTAGARDVPPAPSSQAVQPGSDTTARPPDGAPPLQSRPLRQLTDRIPSTVHRLPVGINEHDLQRSIGDLQDILGQLTAYQLQAAAYDDLQQDFEGLQRDHALLRREVTTLRAELTSTLHQAAPYVTFCQHRYDLLRHRLEDTQLRLAEMESALADRRDNSVEIACLRDRLSAFQRLHADVVAEYNERVDELEMRLASARSTINTSHLAQAIFDQDVAAAERDAAIADRNYAIAARNAAEAERDSVIVERDSAIAARYAAKIDRDRAVKDREAANVARDLATSERDSAIRDRDSAMVDRDAAVAARDSAVGDRDVASKARDKAVAAHAAVREECDVLTSEIQSRRASLKDAEDATRLLRQQVVSMGKEITGLHDQLGHQNTSSRRLLDLSLQARDELQEKLNRAFADQQSRQAALVQALQAQRRAQQDLASTRAQADAQRTRIANLEGQVGSSHQHELSVRHLESEKTALAKGLEAEKRARAAAESDRDKALRDQADAEADRDRLIAECQTVQAQLSSLGSIFGVSVQAPPSSPFTTKAHSSRSRSVPAGKPSSSASRKRDRRASSRTPRPKRSRVSPPVTRGSASRAKADTGSTLGGTPSSPIILSEEEDAKAQTDPENVVKGHDDQENRQDHKDHEDLDNQEDQDDSQDHDHADETLEGQGDQDYRESHDDRGVPVPPTTPPVIPGSDRKHSRGESSGPDSDPSDSSDDDSTGSCGHQSGASDSNDGSSDSLSSHDSDNTLLAAQEHEDLLPTVISRQRWIPGYRRPTTYRRPSDCSPWPLLEVSRLSIRRLRLDTLAAQWTCPKFWLFPRNPRAPPAADWHPELITEANIRALYAANPPPWDALRRIIVPRSFEMNGWFADFCRRYDDFENNSRQVFWETTHKLPITSAMCAAEPFLEQYREDCRVRRMRAGPRWKRLLKHLMAGLKGGECDLDILLDPYFLHFPARGEQVCWYPGQGERQCPADLLAALQIVAHADPWRNQHRADIADHPGSRLARLDRKFFQVDDSD